MCGITGILSYKNDHTIDLVSEVKKMSYAIKHRGPDAEGIYIDEKHSIFLGHRRLSILDLSEKGNQPLSNEEDTIFLVFNGEIYNYIDLYDILKNRHVFKSKTDSEVLIHGYEEWGINGLLERIKGMFAFGIWDKTINKFYLIRDRIGIKPVYYVFLKDMLIFSSEIKSFFSIDDKLFIPEIDLSQLEKLFYFTFLPDNESTIIKNIKKLPPAHYIVFDEGGLDIIRYWKLEKKKEYENISFKEAVEKLDQLLDKCIREHLMSDVPIGILLSGGLDSSLISAIVKRHIGNNRFITLTAKLDHKSEDENFARQVSNYISSDHIELPIDIGEINRNIDRLVWDYDDLSTLDGSLLTIKILCKKINELGIKVVILGEGADEIFGGYPCFRLSQIPFRYMPLMIKSYLYYYIMTENIFFRFFKGNSLAHKILKSAHARDIFSRITRTEVEWQLPNHMLMKVDKGSMAQSIEARVPYLDHELVEFAYSIPQRYKLEGLFFNFHKPSDKYILRKVAEMYLPYNVAHRKKNAFTLPMSDVLNSNMDNVRRRILNANSLSRKLLGNKVEYLFKHTNSSIIARQNESFLWRLFLIETWYIKYFKMK